MESQPTGDGSDVQRRATLPLERIEAELKAEIARRPPDLRLPHKGFRFRALRDATADVAAYIRVTGGGDECVVPLEINRVAVPKGEVLRLDYEPYTADSTHCSLVPERYKELEAVFVSTKLRADETYVGYSFSIPYTQLDADFEWLSPAGYASA